VPLRSITITGEPVLHKPAAAVTEIDNQIQELIDDMYLTMEKAPGVGLAAPQVGVGLRIFVFDYQEGEQHYRGEAINPELELGEISQEWPDEETELEGCLSIPGERFPLKRADRVTLRATNRHGERYEIEATGWLARIFQHEFDHLNGVLYSDRLLKPYVKELKRTIKLEGWGVPGNSWLPGQDFLEP
jgi:peptide deformylase